MSSPDFENPLSIARERLGKVDDKVSLLFLNTVHVGLQQEMRNSAESGALEQGMWDYLKAVYRDPSSLPSAFQAAIYGIYYLAPHELRNSANRMSETGRTPLAALYFDYEKGIVLTLGPIINNFNPEAMISSEEFGFIEPLEYEGSDFEYVKQMLDVDPSGRQFIRRHTQRLRTSRSGQNEYIKPYESRDVVLAGVTAAMNVYEALLPFAKGPK